MRTSPAASYSAFTSKGPALSSLKAVKQRNANAKKKNVQTEEDSEQPLTKINTFKIWS